MHGYNLLVTYLLYRVYVHTCVVNKNDPYLNNSLIFFFLLFLFIQMFICMNIIYERIISSKVVDNKSQKSSDRMKKKVIEIKCN